MSAVTVEEVRRVAELANLQLTPEEETRMARDLGAILGHVAQLAELDTENVEPMAQVSDVLGLVSEGAGGTLRADPVRVSVRSLARRAVMAAAPESDGRFFKVPKVIER